MAEITDDSLLHMQKSLLHLLRRVDQCAFQLYAHEAGNNDITPRQLSVLLAIAQQPGLSQTDLVEITGIDRSTIAGIVSRLLHKGLLERRRSADDGRAYCVRLSKRGNKATAGADRLYSKIEKKLLSGLSTAESDQLSASLKKIIVAHAGDASA